MSGAEVRFGETDLTSCDREPIHIPGSIQPHGVLLVVHRQTLLIEQFAGDVAALLGVDPHLLPGLGIADVIDPDAVDFLKTRLALPSVSVAPIVRLAVPSRRGPQPVDLTLQAAGDTAILEIEPATRTMGAAGDPLEQCKAMTAAVQQTVDLASCCDAAAVAMRAATGFDRSMVYQFLPDGSGVVRSEDARAGLESLLGLHYPASDIPKQARELYLRNWLRTIPNIDYTPSPLQPSLNPRTRQPIDMSHCDLRSVSPIHIEYLRNMGVCASLCASIICRDQLWGMLVLHHGSARYVSVDLRVACETFAQILSLRIESMEQAEASTHRSNTRRIREAVSDRLGTGSDISAVLASEGLMDYVDATGVAVYLDGALHCIGKVPAQADILALIAWLTDLNTPLFASDHLSSEYPAATRFAACASGLLAIGLAREPRDYVLWFRPEIGREVRWAGDPSKPVKASPRGLQLSPRASFAEWLEVTRMHSAPWSALELEAAEALRIVLLESVLRNVYRARRER